MTNAHPPRLADWLLHRLVSGRRREAIIGDLHERFERRRSVTWYWRQAITTILVGVAMKQRLLWVLGSTAVTAALTAMLSYFFIPTRYQSEAVLVVVPSSVPRDVARPSIDGQRSERLQWINQLVLNRTRLEGMVQDFGLYASDRPIEPMDSRIRRMRGDIYVTINANDVGDDRTTALRVAFRSADPGTAMRVTQRIVTMLIEENLRFSEGLAAITNEILVTQIADVRRQIVDKEAELRALRATDGGELSQADLLPYEVLKDTYKTLLVKQQDAKMGVNLERRQLGQQLRLTEPARLPERPMGPSKTTVNVGGILAGLAFGLTVVVVSNRQKRHPTAPQV